MLLQALLPLTKKCIMQIFKLVKYSDFFFLFKYTWPSSGHFFFNVSFSTVHQFSCRLSAAAPVSLLLLPVFVE